MRYIQVAPIYRLISIDSNHLKPQVPFVVYLKLVNSRCISPIFWQYAEYHSCRWVASPQPLSPVGFPFASGGFRSRHRKVCFRRNRRGECSSSMSLVEGLMSVRHTFGTFWILFDRIIRLSPDRVDCIFRHLSIFCQSTIRFFFSSFYSNSLGIRLSTFVFVLLATIYQSESNDFAMYQTLIASGFLAAPISNCFHTLIAVSVFFAFAISSTSLLFFLRARAVFLSNPFATAIFGVLWLGVLGGSLTPSTAFKGENLGPTRYCTIGMIRFYSVAAAIIPLINDIIVFFAISWRLCSNNWTLKNNVRTMISGDYLPAFSKSLLQDGQDYFLSVFYNLFY